MADRRGILMYDSALDASARRRIASMAGADILIGIPSHRNGRTIGEVVQAISNGVKTYLADKRIVLMNADGGSSDNTARHVEDVSMPQNVTTLLTVYEGTTGKGTAVRAILQAASILQVDACLILEARVPGITPEWLPALIEPVLRGDDIALPCYQRSAFGASLTDNIVYPFMCSFMNTDLREALPFEYCLSGQFAAKLANMDVWETDVARFGVNVWMAIQALTQTERACQVDLGYRGDCSEMLGTSLDARFLHTAGTLFRLLAVQPDIWEPDVLPRHVPFQGARCEDRFVACPECVHDLWQACQQERERYQLLWEQILMPDTYAKLERLLEAKSPPVMPIALWARIVIEFAIEYNQGDGDPDKVIEALLPLFNARTASYVLETADMSTAGRDQVANQICKAFAALRLFSRKKWQSYETWEIDETTYWLT